MSISFDTLLVAIQSNDPRITTLDFNPELWHKWKEVFNLTNDDYVPHGLFPEQITGLSQALRSNSTIQTLNLSHIYITPAQLRAIIDAIVENQNCVITRLILSSAIYVDSDLTELSSAIKYMAERLPLTRITELNLSNNEVFSSCNISDSLTLFFANKKLRKLDLSYCRLDATNKSTIQAQLPNNQTLLYLNLLGNGIIFQDAISFINLIINQTAIEEFPMRDVNHINPFNWIVWTFSQAQLASSKLSELEKTLEARKNASRLRLHRNQQEKNYIQITLNMLLLLNPNDSQISFTEFPREIKKLILFHLAQQTISWLDHANVNNVLTLVEQNALVRKNQPNGWKFNTQLSTVTGRRTILQLSLFQPAAIEPEKSNSNSNSATHSNH